MIKQLFVVLALTGGLTIAGPTEVSSEVDLTGIYECNGVGPEGDPYKGVVEIVRKDKTYWVQWTLSPQDVNHGFGIIQGDMFAVEFQNEFSIATLNGEVLVTVPDLICVLDTESGEAIGTEALRYGQRVTAIALPAPPVLMTEKGLRHVGPRAFGFDLEFRSVFDGAPSA